MAVNCQEYYLPHTVFRQLGNLTSYEIETLGTKYAFAVKTDKGLPVFGMMRALNEERKKLTEAFGSNLNKDVGEAKLEYELKYENILSKRILNQAKLGVLISKEEAARRVKTVLRAVMNSVRVALRSSASRLFNMKDATQREIETLLTTEWNSAIKELEQAAKVISWENDGSSSLLQTRLIDIDDPEFVKVLQKSDTEEPKSLDPGDIHE